MIDNASSHADDVHVHGHVHHIPLSWHRQHFVPVHVMHVTIDVQTDMYAYQYLRVKGAGGNGSASNWKTLANCIT